MASQDGWMAGVRDSVPILIAVLPVGLVFGAVAAQNGATAADAMLMSALVYAGASQMVAVDLFGQSVPLWAIAVSVFAVNFRHILYSAAVTPVMRMFSWPVRYSALAILIDPQFALTEKRREERRSVTPGWYFGLGLSIYASWIIESGIGAVFGALIEDPTAFGLDMILPIYFLALVLGFRKRPNWLPVVATSAVVALIVYRLPGLGSPWHVSMGALAGVLVAALLPPEGKAETVEEVADELPTGAMNATKGS